MYFRENNEYELEWSELLAFHVFTKASMLDVELTNTRISYFIKKLSINTYLKRKDNKVV